MRSKMTSLAIIGGTGVLGLAPSDGVSQSTVKTPYGSPSGPIMCWQSAGNAGDKQISFIARHGMNSSIPPHRVNYRANIWALRETGPDYLIAINAVGGIAPKARTGILVFPDQLVDYTWGREHTFEDDAAGPVNHVEFTVPVSLDLRARMIAVAGTAGINFLDSATCAVTQGPRLETAAEIDRLERDGCDIVGMTAMPEAALARELELDYAICAFVINRAAGRTAPGIGIHDEIQQCLDAGMDQVRRLIDAF
jgi:5'-methylthioinosine phosphorylase